MLCPLATLPKDSQAYHVDSIGYVRRNPICSKNHIVDVYLSPVGLSNGIIDTDSIVRTFSKVRQKRYQISIGEFFAFCQGSVISNGTIAQPKLSPNFKARLSINAFTTRTVFGSAREEVLGRFRYVIPPQQWGMGALGLSELVAVERDGDPFSVLIPAVELVRFYHCSSSRLNQALFSSEITELNSLINLKKTSYDANNRTLKITLRKQLPHEDALIIGRWFCERSAYNSALSVWNSLVKLRFNDQLSYIPLQATFPFSGETTIEGRGIELPTPGHVKQPRILLLSLLRCSRPLPFEKLVVDSERPIGTGRSEFTSDIKTARNGMKGYQFKRLQAVSEGKVNDPFSSPSGYVDTELFRVSSDRFPPLKWALKMQDSRGGQMASTSQFEIIEQLNQSTSAVVYSESDSRPISIVPNERMDQVENRNVAGHDFRAFLDVCERLKKCTAIENVSVVELNGGSAEGEKVSSFPLLQSGPGWPWVRVFNRGDKLRARQFIIAEVVSCYGIYYLLSLERKHSEAYAVYIFANVSATEISRKILGSLIEKLADSRFLQYKGTFNELKLNVIPKRHFGSIDQICDGILHKLQSWLPHELATLINDRSSP